MPNALVVILTTVSTSQDAQRLAQQLIDRKLAACVSVQPSVTSFYRWKGQQCKDTEVPLMIKSLPSMAPKIQSFFDECHPYDCPECLILDTSASNAYFKWASEHIKQT